jgi:citronellol/citronellal dehydrogenase
VSSTPAASPLRDGLLEDVSIVLAGAGEQGELAAATATACRALGATVSACSFGAELDLEAQELAAEREAAAAIAAAGEPRVLVVDVASLFGGGGREPLPASLAGAWALTRAVAGPAFLESGAGGRVLLLAPRSGAGAYAGAALAAVENLARTLSIEWARYRATAVAIAPGEDTPAAVVGELVAYLASPAGDYFSGCLLDLRGPAAA